MIKNIFRWLSRPLPANSGKYLPIDTTSITEEDLQRAANSQQGKEVINRFLALSPSKQAKALASLNWQQSYRFRRMLGPEWTKEEDEAEEKAKEETWRVLEAYIGGHHFNPSGDNNVEGGKESSP